MTDEQNAKAPATPATPAAPATPATVDPSSGSRRVLAALFWLLATLAVMVGGVTLWAHQSLLSSNGWANIVAGVASDPEVIESASARIVNRLGESLGVGDRIAEIVPGDVDIVADAITRTVEQRVTEGVAQLASSDLVQDAIVDVNRVAHDAAMKVIRGGDSDALTSADGEITLNVFPLVEGVLKGLQDGGLIDADLKIPDLSGYAPPAETVARLEDLLGRDIPDDIGTITLIESDRLGRVQDAVRVFDIITAVLLLLAVVCIGLAVWLSGRRVRMVLWLAVGSVVALLLGRGFTRLIMEDISGDLGNGGDSVAVRATIESAVDSLMWFTFAIIVAGLMVAAIAIWVERREAAGGGPSTEPQSVEEWLRSRARYIGYVGVGLVVFVVLWNVGGPDITLLAAAAVGVILIAVGVLAGRDDPADGAKEPLADAGSG